MKPKTPLKSKANRKKTIYLISPLIKWDTFKLLQAKLAPQKGIVMVGLDKILWKLLKENKIYCWFEKAGDMALGLKLPKNVKVKTISSPK